YRPWVGQRAAMSSSSTAGVARRSACASLCRELLNLRSDVKTAKALGLEIPLLARADEVIE
ncbi:MAG TPA: hypothetical protein VE178_04855, partial [Silvibacterium sp.]|nr:hypothetical protein [Silvibacterium sp.]